MISSELVRVDTGEKNDPTVRSESCCWLASPLPVPTDYEHAGRTCFSVLRNALSLSCCVDWSHGDGVDGVGPQVLQHGVVGAA